MRTHFSWVLVEFELAVPVPDGMYQVPLAFVLTYCAEMLVVVVVTGFPVNETYGPPYEPRPEPARTMVTPTKTPAMTPSADLPDLMVHTAACYVISSIRQNGLLLQSAHASCGSRSSIHSPHQRMQVGRVPVDEKVDPGSSPLPSRPHWRRLEWVTPRRMAPFYGLERSFDTIGITPSLPHRSMRKMQIQTMKTNHTSRRAITSTLSVVLGAIILLSLTGLPAMEVHATSFNAVQIFVSDDSSLQYSYSYSAYNQTGNLVGSYQSSYPAAAFELPAGGYLFTVSALREGYSPCLMCAQPMVRAGQVNGNVSGITSSGKSTSTSSGSSTAVPVYLIQPASLYGYAVETVSGPATFTIQTQNVTLLPTGPVTVKVTFANGTAAVGADVSASIVGQYYYWWSPTSNVVMSNQTNSLGIAHLVIPQAPAVITAWDWVPVNLPMSNNTTPAKIGGQTINVTVYWQQTYVGLSASAMVIPPNNTANLILHSQQPKNWIMPMGVATAPANSSAGSNGTIANKRTGVPSTVQSAPSQTGSQVQYFLPSAIPSIEAVGGTTGSTTTADTILGGGVTTVAIAATAVILATLGVAVVILRTRSHHQ